MISKTDLGWFCRILHPQKHVSRWILFICDNLKLKNGNSLFCVFSSFRNGHCKIAPDEAPDPSGLWLWQCQSSVGIYQLCGCCYCYKLDDRDWFCKWRATQEHSLLWRWDCWWQVVGVTCTLPNIRLLMQSGSDDFKEILIYSYITFLFTELYWCVKPKQWILSLYALKYRNAWSDVHSVLLFVIGGILHWFYLLELIYIHNPIILWNILQN